MIHFLIPFPPNTLHFLGLTNTVYVGTRGWLHGFQSLNWRTTYFLMSGGEDKTRWGPGKIFQHVILIPGPSFLPPVFSLTTPLSSPCSISDSRQAESYGHHNSHVIEIFHLCPFPLYQNTTGPQRGCFITVCLQQIQNVDYVLITT